MQQDWVILKFGGSSVGEATHWQTIVDQVQINLDKQIKPVLVLSALKNVSNLLEAMLHQALAGVHPLAIDHLSELHLGFASKLGLELSQQLTPWFNQLTEDCQSIHQQKQISPKNHARILAIGELLSTTIGAAYLTSKGFSVHWQDARALLTSNSQQDQWHHYTSAICDYSSDPIETKKLADAACDTNSVIVTQGFIAADHNADTVLLGREGSDTSAAYLGAILKARQIEIWTDVTGVFSANPREILNTRQLPALTYQHACKMAKFGAKVLHPRAIAPAQQNQIPLSVRCTGQPQHPGTVISDHGDKTLAVKAVVYHARVCQLILSGLEYGKESEQKLNQVIQRLAAAGYDLLIEQKQVNKAPALDFKNTAERSHPVSFATHLVLNYINSDQPQPNEKELEQVLNQLPIQVNQNCALITLVAESDRSQWLIDQLQLLESETTAAVIESYLSHQKDSLSLLVNAENCYQLSMLLHKHFIVSK